MSKEPILPIQTIKDNTALLKPELRDKINTLVVAAGHTLVKKEEEIKARCDGFVVETNVHYPIDSNLLFYATRKAVELTANLCLQLVRHFWVEAKQKFNFKTQQEITNYSKYKTPGCALQLKPEKTG